MRDFQLIVSNYLLSRDAYGIMNGSLIMRMAFILYKLAIIVFDCFIQLHSCFMQQNIFLCVYFFAFYLFAVSKKTKRSLELESKTDLQIWTTDITAKRESYGQARSQKFAKGGLFGAAGGGAPSRRRPMGVWGRSPQLPEAGVWGQSPQPPEARGSGGGAPSARKFCIFLQK